MMDAVEPVEPGPEECCGEGCSSCVWDVYREKLQRWQQVQTGDSLIENSLSKLHFGKCILKSVCNQTNDTSVYSFLVPNINNSRLELKPGQHLELRAFYNDEEIIRKYSPISWNFKCFDVIIKRYDTGKMSAYLEQLKEGDDTEWRGPYGNFKYNSKDQKLLLVLCAGTGVAPMIPIIRNIMSQCDEDDETLVKMLCGCHTLESRLLLPQIKELAAYWNFSYVHHVTSSQGTPGWGESVVRGRITEDNVAQAVANVQPSDCHVLLCGPQQFCDDFKLITGKLGLKCYCF